MSSNRYSDFIETKRAGSDKYERAVDFLVRMIQGAQEGFVEGFREPVFSEALTRLNNLNDESSDLLDVFADFVIDEYRTEFTEIGEKLFPKSNKTKKRRTKEFSLEKLDFPNKSEKHDSIEKHIVDRITSETGYRASSVFNVPTGLHIFDNDDSYSSGFNIHYIEEDNALTVYLMDDSDMDQEEPLVISTSLESTFMGDLWALSFAFDGSIVILFFTINLPSFRNTSKLILPNDSL